MTIAPKIVRRVATIDENTSVLDATNLMTEAFIGRWLSAILPGLEGTRKTVGLTLPIW